MSVSIANQLGASICRWLRKCCKVGPPGMLSVSGIKSFIELKVSLHWLGWAVGVPCTGFFFVRAIPRYVKRDPLQPYSLGNIGVQNVTLVYVSMLG